MNTPPPPRVDTVATDDWGDVCLYHNGNEFFDALEDAILGARHSVYLESYIFADDRLGERILTALTTASSRGVDVRVIVDGIGSHAWLERIKIRVERHGVAFKVFNQLPWQRVWNQKRGVAFSKALYDGLRRINHRTHLKICIIDGSVSFVGSMNIIEYHCGRYVGASAWRDVGVRVSGGETSLLQDSFLRLWDKKARRNLLTRRLTRKRLSSGYRVKLNSKRRFREQNYVDLLVLLLSAERRIWIENAYFVPYRRLLRTLEIVGRSGVDVRIMVPAYADVFFIPWVSAAFHRGLLKAGVRIFEYTKGMLHAKTILVDGYGVVGSSNLNHRSLFHDLEVDVHFENQRAVESLERQFLDDTTFCREVTLESWYARPLIQRFIGRMLLLVRGIL